MNKRIRFILNPLSGKGKNQLLPTIIERELKNSGIDYDIAVTESRRHATELSKEAARLGYYGVVAIGGDGTVNECGRGVMGTNTALGIVPGGSGNGIARSLKIPVNPVFAIRGLKSCYIREIDTGILNNEMFIGVAGIGFDSHIANLFSKLKNRGLKSYVRLITREFGRFKVREFEIIRDGKSEKKFALMITFANSNQYGNEAMIAPQAKPDDGKIEVCMLKKFPLYVFPSLSYRLFTGKINQSVFYESFSCDSVIVNQKEVIAHIDGEPVETGTEIKVSVNPASLKMLIPEFK